MHLSTQSQPMQVRHLPPPTRGDLEMRLRCAGAQARGSVWDTSTAAFPPERHTCKAGEVPDVFPPGEATQVLKPEGLHKVVQRQGNLEPLPAAACKCISRDTTAWRALSSTSQTTPLHPHRLRLPQQSCAVRPSAHSGLQHAEYLRCVRLSAVARGCTMRSCITMGCCWQELSSTGTSKEQAPTCVRSRRSYGSVPLRPDQFCPALAPFCATLHHASDVTYAALHAGILVASFLARDSWQTVKAP